ncbi:MAG: alanine racemase domain-containing protein [Puniceicoccaceae bacterium 5H]|nr:MAG: alanine racemase domain-containing protein [Puniceicoccaceae bacterium 5H]
MPVTKTWGPEAVSWCARAGLKRVGENRVQEAVDKQEQVPEQVAWELIGHLQSNKARQGVTHFARIQSVDSAKLLRLLDRYAGEARVKRAVLLQVNAGEDPAKYGVTVEQTPALLEAALGCENLIVDGLMTIAPLEMDDRSVARRCFARLRETRDRLAEQFGVPLPVLSMGMSGDWREAVEEGSTLIRVGSALFGQRG